MKREIAMKNYEKETLNTSLYLKTSDFPNTYVCYELFNIFCKKLDFFNEK